MITILPLRDKNLLDEFNKQNKQNANSAFCLYDGDSIDGYILYNVKKDLGEILVINSNDEPYIDGLVRATLASLYDFGINEAVFSNNLDVKLLEKLGLLKNKELKVSSIKELIFDCKNCKTKNSCNNCT